MTTNLRVDAYDHTVAAAVAMGRREKAGFILRIQEKKELLFNLNNGETEEIATISLRGMGIQVCTPEGYTGFASSDRIDPSTVEELFRQALALAKRVEAVKGEVNTALFNVPPNNRRVVMSLKHPYGSCSLGEIEERLVKLNKSLAMDPRLSVRTVHRLVDEEWRVVRHDGTDTAFMTPRSFIYNTFTARENGKTATTYCNLPGTDLSILLNRRKPPGCIRSVLAAKMALTSKRRDREERPKLVIDYALAKGWPMRPRARGGDRRDGKLILGERSCAGDGGGRPHCFDIDARWRGTMPTSR